MNEPTEQHPPKRSEIAQMLNHLDLSVTNGFKVTGPWGHKSLEGFKTPIYIFVPGGERVEIGEATVTIKGGLFVAIELQEEYKDVPFSAFEIPMRFRLLNLNASVR